VCEVWASWANCLICRCIAEIGIRYLGLVRESIVVVIVTIHKKTNELLGEPEMISRGFVYMKESANLIKESQKVVKKTLRSNGKVRNWLMVKEKITGDLERFLFKKTARRPMVLPVIVDV
jgi:ribonuclease J